MRHGRNIIVNFADGTFLDIPEEGGHEDDIESVIPDILSYIQMRIDCDELDVKWRDDEHIDIVETIGIKSINVNSEYTPVASNDDIREFIDMFHQYRDVSHVFTRGCCYWFAKILHDRFPESKIIYIDPVHFVTEINGRLYDITGDVTEKYVGDSYYHLASWDDIPDGLEKDRIISDSILFDNDKYFHNRNKDYAEKIKSLLQSNKNATEISLDSGKTQDELAEELIEQLEGNC